MAKIVLIGAVSTVFARQFITGILEIGGLNAGQFAVVDVDEARFDS